MSINLTMARYALLCRSTWPCQSKLYCVDPPGHSIVDLPGHSNWQCKGKLYNVDLPGHGKVSFIVLIYMPTVRLALMCRSTWPWQGKHYCVDLPGHAKVSFIVSIYLTMQDKLIRKSTSFNKNGRSTL